MANARAARSAEQFHGEPMAGPERRTAHSPARGRQAWRAARFTRTVAAATRNQTGAGDAASGTTQAQAAHLPPQSWGRRILRALRQRLGAWPQAGAAFDGPSSEWRVAHREAGEAQAEGDLARAARLYQRAADLNPRAPGVFRDWAGLLQSQGREDRAIEKYLVVLSLDPEHASAYDALSQLFQGRGADLQYNWGRILERRGALAGAEAFYRRAIDLAPGSQLAARASRRLATVNLLSLSASAIVSAGGSPIEERAT